MGRSKSSHFFLLLFIYFFNKNHTFYKYADIYYKKGQDEEHYFIFINYFMYCSNMFNKSTTTQNN